MRASFFQILVGLTFYGIWSLPAVSLAFPSTSYIWTGNALNGNWSSPENWLDQVAPPLLPADIYNETDIRFGGSALATANLPYDYELYSLTFTVGTNPTTFSGGKITFRGGISGQNPLPIGIQHYSASPQVITNQVELMSVNEWHLADGSGKLTLTNGLTLPGASLDVIANGSAHLEAEFHGHGFVIVRGGGTVTATGVSTLYNITGNPDLIYNRYQIYDGSRMYIPAGAIVENSGFNVRGGSAVLIGGRVGTEGTNFNFLVSGESAISKASEVELSGSDSEWYTGFDLIGAIGVANVLQKGGKHKVTQSIFLGTQAGGNGIYQLQGGTVEAKATVVGQNNLGSFFQSGGSHTIDDVLIVGSASGAQGYYSLSDGELSTRQSVISNEAGDRGDLPGGNFVQSGGSHNVSENLIVGFAQASTGKYTLSGGTLKTDVVAIGYGGTGSFEQSGGFQEAFAIVLGNNAQSDGQYLLTGGTAIATQVQVGVSGKGTLEIRGNETALGVGTMVLGVQGAGEGTLLLNGGHTYASNIVSPLGKATVVFNGGMLHLGEVSDQNPFLANVQNVYVGAGGAKIEVNADHTTNRNFRADPSLGSAIDGGITKSGNRTLALSFSSDLNGPVDVMAGALLANNTFGSATGSGAVTVHGGATLGGTGFISGAVTVNADGTLAPGASIESLSLGSLMMAAGSVLEIELDLGGSLNGDLLAITGDVNVDGAELRLSLANAPSSLASPLTFLIGLKDSDSAILGNFDSITGLPLGYETSLIYDFGGFDSIGRQGNGNDLAIVITAVPEPATGTGLSLLAALSLAASRRQRRHRNKVAV